MEKTSEILVILGPTASGKTKLALDFAKKRFEGTSITKNADADGTFLEQHALLEPDAVKVLQLAAEKFKLSARGYHRTIRVARTIADLALSETIHRIHVQEALAYRNPFRRIH